MSKRRYVLRTGSSMTRSVFGLQWRTGSSMTRSASSFLSEDRVIDDPVLDSQRVGAEETANLRFAAPLQGTLGLRPKPRRGRSHTMQRAEFCRHL